MAKLFVLIKKKGNKKWKGAIPAKKGVSKVQLRKSVRSQLKSGFTFKIITAGTMKKILRGLKALKQRKRSKKRRKR